MKTAKTITELRNELSEIFDELRQNPDSRKLAAELANVAGKMIASAKAQLEYYALRNERPVITFLVADAVDTGESNPATVTQE